MSEKKRVLGSDLRKIDAHVITPEEYAEVPELKQGFFEQADEYKGGKLVRRGRGRPQAATRKVLLSVSYSPEVVEYFRATGEGWQMRMDQVLREHVTWANRYAGNKAIAPIPPTGACDADNRLLGKAIAPARLGARLQAQLAGQWPAHDHT
ncbi:MAG: BrnA antitoxin family protein [Gammaproteobacteria bacterium]